MEHKISRKSKNYLSGAFASPIFQIRIDDICPNQSQPRSNFDNDSLLRLADSIKRYGIIQPLVVRHSSIDEAYSYELIAGERRLRAAKLLCLLTVPCIIVEADEKRSAEMAIIENLLRKDLNMFEEARAFKKLIDIYDLTQEEVAKRMSMSQSAIANKIRLLRLTDEEEKLILERGLSERHARALLKIEDPQLRREAILYISSMSLNVINSEQYIETLAKMALTPEKTQQKEENSSSKSDKKSAKAFVENIQKRIATLNKQGRSATVNVTDGAESIELHIKIAK